MPLMITTMYSTSPRFSLPPLLFHKENDAKLHKTGNLISHPAFVAVRNAKSSSALIATSDNLMMLPLPVFPLFNTKQNQINLCSTRAVVVRPNCPGRLLQDQVR